MNKSNNNPSQEENNNQPKGMSMEDIMAAIQQQQQPTPLSDELKEKHKDTIQALMDIQRPMVELQVQNQIKMSELFNGKNIAQEEFDQIINHCENELNDLYHEKMNEIYGNKSES